MSDEVIYEVVQGDSLFIDVEPLDEDNVAFDFTGVQNIEVGLSWSGGAWSDNLVGGVSAANGIISAKTPAATTATLPVGDKVTLQVRITDSAGEPITIALGRVRVKRKAL